ncbi:MAG TPA: c-type cytochrome domain-containing protein, partial [Gammaproteobacteria bacterium]|nr:c-type cytochrome domain-containing protein [Gammaproteobacteria bacterium]
MNRVAISALAASVAAAFALTGCGPSPQELAARNHATISKYCFDCHNDTEQVAGLSLQSLDIAHVGKDAETWEKVVKMLRSGQMPPRNGRRPDQQTRTQLVSYLTNRLDANYKPILPPPGAHRLNRTEYQNVIHDLL